MCHLGSELEPLRLQLRDHLLQVMMFLLLYTLLGVFGQIHLQQLRRLDSQAVFNIIQSLEGVVVVCLVLPELGDGPRQFADVCLDDRLRGQRDSSDADPRQSGRGSGAAC